MKVNTILLLYIYFLFSVILLFAIQNHGTNISLYTLYIILAMLVAKAVYIFYAEKSICDLCNEMWCEVS